MIQSVLESPPPMLSSAYFSPEFCEFLHICLQKQPLDRAFADVLLESPWLQRCAAVSTSTFLCPPVVDSELLTKKWLCAVHIADLDGAVNNVREWILSLQK